MLKGIIDEVPTNCNADVVGVFFLRLMINDNPCIRDRSIQGNVADFHVGEEEDCVGGFCDASLALCQSMDFHTHHGDPEIFQVWVVH